MTMTRQSSDTKHDDERRQTIKDFKQAVNMTPSQLEKWLATEDSQRVGQKDGNGESVGHQSGRRIIDLLHRHAGDLSDDDVAHMRKVVGYIHRHLAQGPTKKDPASSDWRYSLMNWGHDPEKS
jgi:delta 1-pyrroline-5-carboxylate dehydrogenase